MKQWLPYKAKIRGSEDEYWFCSICQNKHISEKEAHDCCNISEDEFYEIEKVLDIQSAWISDKLNEYCKTSIHADAVKKEIPIREIIVELDSTRKAYKVIRDKLKKIRLMNQRI